VTQPPSDQLALSGAPTLDEIAHDPAKAASLAPQMARALLARCVIAQAALLAPALAAATPTHAAARVPTTDDSDCYLTIPAVATRTGLSLSYLYELARAGRLPVRRMGREEGGKRQRGYRILRSDLLVWEAGLRRKSIDAQLSDMLSRPRDRQRVPTAQKAARADTSATRAQVRRASDHRLAPGARSGAAHPGARGQADSAPGTEPSV
jgi:excisionase family DNA binding protein